MKYIYILISSAIVIYLILLTLIYVNQRKLLYLPSENNYLDDPINFNYKELFIEVDIVNNFSIPTSLDLCSTLGKSLSNGS